MRVGINGFGRIGRCLVRALFERSYDDLSLVAINGGSNVEHLAHLLQYDSVHGRFSKDVVINNENEIKIGSKLIKITNERDIDKLKWDGVDVVFECTGKFLTKESASVHIANRASKVILSAPPKDSDIPMIVWKINSSSLASAGDVVSIGSCTTNCLAPVAKVLHEKFGIQSGFMTTVHAYTNDQNLVDNSHKGDLRRARNAVLSMIPTSTGAAKAIGAVIPELKGKLDGVAVRVPTPNVSMIDLCCNLETSVTREAINEAMLFASNDNLNGMLAYSSAPLVSIDFNHSDASSIFDALETRVIGDKFIRVAAWYDNEWSFALRMLDIAREMKVKI